MTHYNTTNWQYIHGFSGNVGNVINICDKHNQCIFKRPLVIKSVFQFPGHKSTGNFYHIPNYTVNRKEKYYFTARISLEINISNVTVFPILVFFPRLLQGTGAAGCLVLSVERLSDLRSSAGWTASQVPHTGRHH